jgi:succinate dehydrogenase flavin-adding protein (antitoxin of CptAB toxin-antitoxin module)
MLSSVYKEVAKMWVEVRARGMEEKAWELRIHYGTWRGVLEAK